MNLRCENCGHAALDTDSTCWHCGEPLPGREERGREEVKVRESWTRDAGPGSIVIFGGLTLLVVIAALLVMNWLGQQPRLQARLGARTRPGWTFLTAANRAFTISLPDDWSWLDTADPDAAAALASLVDQESRWRLATHPLGAEISDMTIVFAAGSALPNESQGPILVVASSPLLNGVTYQEVVNFLSNSDYDVGQVRYVDNFDKSHVSIVIDTPLDDALSEAENAQAIRCRQQFVLGRQKSLLISLCAPTGRFAAFSNTFDEILESFQHLDTP